MTTFYSIHIKSFLSPTHFAIKYMHNKVVANIVPTPNSRGNIGLDGAGDNISILTDWIGINQNVFKNLYKEHRI